MLESTGLYEESALRRYQLGARQVEQHADLPAELFGEDAPMSTPETAPEIQQEIERTRERLGETVEELAAKVDVKARARDKAADIKAKAQVTVADVRAKAPATATEWSGRVRRSQVVQRRWPLAVVAGVAVVGTVAIWRRRRK